MRSARDFWLLINKLPLFCNLRSEGMGVAPRSLSR
jgi:hypothetical protein